MRIPFDFLNVSLQHFFVLRQEEPLIFMAHANYRNIIQPLLGAFARIGKQDSEVAKLEVWSERCYR